MNLIRRSRATLKICYLQRYSYGSGSPSFATSNIQTKCDSSILNKLVSRRYSTSTTTTHSIAVTENDGIIRKLKKKFGWADTSKPRIRVSSYTLYESVADCINYKIFFDKFNLPNTFNSWFLVTELHVWMLLVRAMAEGSERDQDGRFMRNCIVEAMWTDVNKRAKELGSQNPSGVRNQIYTLSQQFQASLIAYDEALCGDDKLLASVLWLRFLERKCDNYELLELLVKYVRKQTKILESIPRQEFVVKPKVKWISIQEL